MMLVKHTSVCLPARWEGMLKKTQHIEQKKLWSRGQWQHREEAAQQDGGLASWDALRVHCHIFQTLHCNPSTGAYGQAQWTRQHDTHYKVPEAIQQTPLRGWEIYSMLAYYNGSCVIIYLAHRQALHCGLKNDTKWDLQTFLGTATTVEK